MKNLLRIFAILLLMAVVLMSLARRENSGWIAFVAGFVDDDAIYLMSGDGRSIRQVTPDHMCTRTGPQWSPDGGWITFTDECQGANETLLRISPGGTNLQPIVSASDHQWSPDGQWLRVRRGALRHFILGADWEVQHSLPRGYSLPQWSPDGEWIYAIRSLRLGRALDRIHVETGAVEGVISSPEGGLFDPGWSPDAARMVITLPTDHGDELFTMSPDGGNLQPISIDLPVSNVRRPQFSPDGEWIAFWGREPSDNHLYRIRPNGDDLQQLTDWSGSVQSFAWSPDGMWVLFSAHRGDTSRIFRVRADGSAIENLAAGHSPAFAPVVGVDWHPLWLIIAALGMMGLSLKGGFRL